MFCKCGVCSKHCFTNLHATSLIEEEGKGMKGRGEGKKGEGKEGKGREGKGRKGR